MNILGRTVLFDSITVTEEAGVGSVGSVGGLTINYQPSTINYQLSTLNSSLLTPNCQSSTVNYQL
ncbi:MAG: hypothetical protein QNJ36_19920 [Calothrix sp. MO_167.B42]|nr:hypothetical protein [Calothrix sp. MO_167.B42]